MKTYSRYKRSGIEYVGEIPEHWDTQRLGSIGIFSASGIDKKNIEGQKRIRMVNYTDVYGNRKNILSGNQDYMITTAPHSKIKEHSLKKGDILFTPSSETIEDIGVSAVVLEDLPNVVYSYHLIRLRPSILMDIAFSKYLCNHPGVLHQFSSSCKGTIRKFVTRDNFKNIKVILPPIDEQQAIADFLDQKTSQIDTLVSKKQRLIELLQEYRNALINQAVTKGLNPNVPMKDSGYDWVGEIPDHWGIMRIKHLVKKQKNAIKTGPFGSQLTNSDMSESEVKVYNQRSVIDSDFTGGDKYVSNEKYEQLKDFEIYPGDILITTRGTIGKCAIFPKGAEMGILHPCLIRIQVDEELAFKEYLIWYIQDSLMFQESVSYESNSTTIDVIYSGTLREVVVPIPPLSEQKKIIGYLMNQDKKISEACNKLEKQVELLTEYRNTLISNTVTGKIDVRNWKGEEDGIPAHCP